MPRPPNPLATADGRIVVVGGASRSGKTAYVAGRVKTDRRILAWDPEQQWATLPGFRLVTDRRALLDAIQTPGHARIAFYDLDPTGFDLCCAAAFWWGCHRGPLTYIAEELADVSNPGKAPRDWGVLVRRGLKRGINIYAISQRWAEADKTVFGNASEFVAFSLASAADEKYMASKTRIPLDKLQALTPTDKVKPFLHYDVASKAVTEGALRFR